MTKLFWVDLETTGTQPGHEITECAVIVEINGEVKLEKNVLVRPIALDDERVSRGEVRPIDEEALALTGVTIDDLYNPRRASPEDLKISLSNLLDQYVDKFNRADKFILAGHNVEFDQRFLKELWDRCGDRYFGSWFAWKVLNLADMISIWQVVTGKSVPSYKLEDVAQTLGVELEAHKAINDIHATRECFYKMLAEIRETS